MALGDVDTPTAPTPLANNNLAPAQQENLLFGSTTTFRKHCNKEKEGIAGDEDRTSPLILDVRLLVHEAQSSLKRVLLLTGSPGVGKTTVLTRTAETLAERGFRVGGMISREVRKKGVRIGFEILDWTDRRRGWLAQAGHKGGPRVGKYAVNLKDLEAIDADSIIRAVEKCDIVAIDEIGPMELFSNEFREATIMALQSQKLVLAVVHWKSTDRLLADVKGRADSETFLVTFDNREKLVELVASKALEYLEQF